MLSALSPTIKKSIAKYRTENKKLATLFKNLIPTMVDEDIIDIISVKAKEKSPTKEQEIVDILKNVTGSRLPDLLSTIRVNVPELNFEKIVAQLMGELKTSKGEKVVDELLSKDLEIQMRTIFPRLRDQSHEKRIKAVDELMGFSDRIFEIKNYDLIRLVVDRLDAMADAETEMKTFKRVIAAMKSLYMTRGLKKHDFVQFVSKKFGKHLLRKDAALLERKITLIKAISDIKDENYVPELISLLWDPGTFVEARAALTSLAEFSVPLLIDTLKDTENRSIRMKIIDVLIKIGDKAISKIEKMLFSSEWYIRRNGVFILGEMKASSAVDAIGKLIDDDEEQVQLAVIASFRKIGGDKMKDYIKTAMDSKYRQVAIKAMRSLEKDDVKEKLNDVVMWLKSRKGVPNKEEEKYRRDIIGLIGKFGDDSVIDELVALLNEKAIFKGSLLQPTKVSALNALVMIGSEKAIGALRDATNHKNQFVAGSAQNILIRYEAK
jgi:HEAT repeat protein